MFSCQLRTATIRTDCRSNMANENFSLVSGNSSPVRSGTSPNGARVRDRVSACDKVGNKNKLHFGPGSPWLWWPLVMPKQNLAKF